jgi:4-coumarate--CoA ligase
LKIIDNDGNRLGVNETGEIWSKSYYPFLGYANNETETAEAMDNTGFIRSGDLGYFNEDGFLCLVDRKKDIMNYCNNQV